MFYPRSRSSLLFPLLLAVLLPFAVSGQPASTDESSSASKSMTAGDLFVSGSMLAGFGVENHDVGVTSDDQKIQISAGGGAGFGFQIGQFVTDRIAIQGEIAYQSSVLSIPVDNGEGSFNRAFVAANVLYHIPVKKNNRFLVGGGFGYYLSGKMDLDFSGAADIGGAHNVYEYEPAIGFRVRLCYELMNYTLFKRIHMGFGVQYSSISYALKSVTSDGVEYPTSMIPASVLDEYETLDGSAIEFLMYFIYYL